ncbi:oxalate oxidase 1-like [Triticum dicoccoides]|uniref:oxalate oxidase 1-like n=1 Tax=Triticum dicoccoides TaxID=85692 RepID=UPI00188E2CB8|nr:oxalate oxidase 1-like [Triticum dicoccoides]
MAYSKTIACLFTMLLLGPTIMATEPDPLQDFCVADLDDNAVRVNGYPCVPQSEVGDDFLFSSKLAKGGNTSTPNGSAVTRLDVTEFPGENTQGISMNRVDFAPGGTNPPHIHPRATEIGLVVKGKLLVGIIDSNESGNKLHSRVVHAGENFLMPRGLMHFQFNVGKTEASMVVSFNSQNPGIVFVPLTLFGSDPPIPTPVLTRALRVDAEVVELLKSRFAGGSFQAS